MKAENSNNKSTVLTVTVTRAIHALILVLCVSFYSKAVSTSEIIMSSPHLDRLSPSKSCGGPVSRMDERTVSDLDKCFCRVIEHLNEQGVAGVKGNKKSGGGGRRKQHQQEDLSNKDLLQEVLPIALYFLELQPLVRDQDCFNLTFNMVR